MNKVFSKPELNAVVSWLKEHFPKAFANKGSQVVPLQRGVIDHIFDFYERLDYPPFSKKLLRAGLNYYTSSTAYLKAQEAGVMRIDLFGFDVETVTEEQQAYAQQKLLQRKTAAEDRAMKNQSKNSASGETQS